MDLPLVTIGIPTYNRAELFERALKSALAQSYPNLEILVSDNHSPDDTPEVVFRYPNPRIRYIRQTQNIGMVGNWNACLKEAKGQYFLLLSDDDILLPTGIESLLNAYTRYPNAAFVYGHVDAIGNPVGTKYPKYPPSPEQENPTQAAEGFLTNGRATFACGILYRLDAVTQKMDYSDTYGLLFDAQFWIAQALERQQPVVFCSEPVAQYLLHTSNESFIAGEKKWMVETLRLLEWYLTKTGQPDTCAFARQVRFRALTQLAIGSASSRLSRFGQVLSLALRLQPKPTQAIKQLAKSVYRKGGTA